jgi:hypothetical protein
MVFFSSKANLQETLKKKNSLLFGSLISMYNVNFVSIFEYQTSLSLSLSTFTICLVCFLFAVELFILETYAINIYSIA